ncbi:hypothetical protein RHMOL_Rhmol01G0302500 [Rhododendron molle]|uniref:Uncharacterized protein n=1 Tax=Rhododendron molle TaxID=49168 RepID=A0ACC0Q984_RHOML|nr:hypothetical protein RHMOL_Rhmol01G0302500 [Rhododendron molle]
MATLSSQFHITNHKSHRNVKRRTSSSISCSMQPSQSNSKVCDMEEPLEIPIVNDLTIVLGSISQATAFCEKATMVSAG